jgi:very-short-patch-repair endonuclease
MSLPPSLVSLADLQSGALSREQLLGYGVTDRVIGRLVSDERLARISRGVYATHAGGWSQLAWAGVLIGGSSAVVGLQAAAHLSGLLPDAPEQVAIFAPTHHRHRDRRWRFIEAERRSWGDPPRTRIAQTVIDLSAELSDEAVVSLLAEAVGRGRIRASELGEMLAALARHPKRALLTDVLAEVTAGSHSPLELRYAKEVERAHGLPPAVRQASPLSGHRTDGWYPDFGLVIELDGRAFHSGANALNDMDRDNAHLLAGLVTLRFGWRQVSTNPCGVAATVAGALTRAGWTGRSRTCSRCRSMQHRTFRT